MLGNMNVFMAVLGIIFIFWFSGRVFQPQMG